MSRQRTLLMFKCAYVLLILYWLSLLTQILTAVINLVIRGLQNSLTDKFCSALMTYEYLIVSSIVCTKLEYLRKRDFCTLRRKNPRLFTFILHLKT